MNETKRATSRTTGIKPVLGATVPISTSLCLFGTFHIFQANSTEFDATLGNLLPILAVVCLGLIVILTLLGLAIPKRFRPFFVAILISVGLMSWVQGGFIRWEYGEFDGTSIDWSSYSWQGWVDAAIWLVALIVAVRLRSLLTRHAVFIAIGFVLSASSGYAVNALRSSGEITTASTPAETSVAPEEMCNVSGSINVFHLILDSFQSDVFTELVEEEDLSESFDGFVMFPENISNGWRTILAVPASLSADIYDGSQSLSEYFAEATLASEAGSPCALLNRLSKR